MRAVRSCITMILVFAAGLAIGLVVLGWWLYPVQWENGNMEVVNSVQQEDYLRAAIDSYELNGDQNLAINRYGNLGAFGPATLTAIQENPGSQNPQSIQIYSQAVVGGDGTVVVPETTPEADLASQFRRSISDPRMAAVLFLALLLIVVLIAIFFVVRRGRKKEAETPEGGEVPAAPASDIPVADEAKMVEIPVEEAAAEGEIAEGEADAVEDVAAQAEAPANESEGLGAAGLVAAGAVAAAVLSGDEGEVPEGGEEPAVEDGEVPEGGEVPAMGAEEAVSEAAVVDAVEAGEAEQEGGIGLAGLAAAGLAGAAVVAAAKGGEVEEEAAAALPELPEAEWQPEIEVPVEAEGESGVGAGGVAAAALVGAALLGGEDEENAPEGDVAPLAAADGEWQPEAEVETAAPGPTLADEIAALYYRDVVYIEGVGPVYGQKLKEAGIRTPADLLTVGASRKGREELAEKTGISHKLLLEWVNHVDLFRVKGVGQEYADLLEAAGVDTVPELAQRVPANLHQKMIEVNEEKNLVRKPPVLSQVESWVEQAKSLQRIVTY